MGRVWITILALLAGIWAGSLSAGQSGMEALRGTWEGPWYIGMSSGKARIEIDASGAGMIAFTNLENFTDRPVALEKASFDGKAFRFTASGEGAHTFSAVLQMRDGGEEMRGNGKYGGFGARVELKRAD